MKNNFLPFQLGEQYELWEFDLEVAGDRLKGYDSYTFIPSVESFGLFTTSSTELIFSLDILEAVILSFKPPSVLYALRKALYVNRKALVKELKDGRNEVSLIIIKRATSVHLLYGRRNVIQKLIHTIH